MSSETCRIQEILPIAGKDNIELAIINDECRSIVPKNKFETNELVVYICSNQNIKALNSLKELIRTCIPMYPNEESGRAETMEERIARYARPMPMTHEHRTRLMAGQTISRPPIDVPPNYYKIKNKSLGRITSNGILLSMEEFTDCLVEQTRGRNDESVENMFTNVLGYEVSISKGKNKCVKQINELVAKLDVGCRVDGALSIWSEDCKAKKAQEERIKYTTRGQIEGKRPDYMPDIDIYDMYDTLNQTRNKSFTVEITEKIDGISCIVACVDDKLVVCGRGGVQRDTPTNLYWAVIRSLGLEKILLTKDTTYSKIIIYGTIVGRQIKDNYYKFIDNYRSETNCYMYIQDIYDKERAKFYTPKERRKWLENRRLGSVPILYDRLPSKDITDTKFLLDIVEQDTHINSGSLYGRPRSGRTNRNRREIPPKNGIIIRRDGDYSEEDTDFRFEVISNEFTIENTKI